MIIVDDIHADADLMSVFERLGRRMNEEGFDEEFASSEEQESTRVSLSERGVDEGQERGQGTGDLRLDNDSR